MVRLCPAGPPWQIWREFARRIVVGFGPCPGFHFGPSLRRELDHVPGRHHGSGRCQRLALEFALELARESAQESAQELAQVAVRGPVRVFAREPALGAAPEAGQGLALVFERELDWTFP